MKCKKCGESLHPEQKACLACGTPTDQWPGGVPEEEKKPVEIPWRQVGIIGGGLLLLIIILTIGMRFRVVPPDKVTTNWMDAITSRNITRAKELTTEKFESLSMDQPMSERKADEYYGFQYGGEGKYTVSPPTFNGPTSAVVRVVLAGPNNQSYEDKFALIRVGRQWKIDGFAP